MIYEWTDKLLRGRDNAKGQTRSHLLYRFVFYL